MRPKVLCLVQLPPPLHGVSVCNQRVVESEVINGAFELQVLELRFAEGLSDVGTLSLAKLVAMVKIFLKLFGSLIRFRPDSVYFTLSPTGFAFYRDAVYVLLIKFLGTKCILHLHGKGIASTAKGWRRWLYRLVFNGQHIVSLSERLSNDVADVYSRKPFVVNNGIAAQMGCAPDNKPSVAVPRILFLSNLVRDKGVLDLLATLGRVSRSGRRFECRIAGASFDITPEQLQAAIAHEGLQDKVIYVGPAYGADKASLLQWANIFAFPSRNDAFPLVILEAMQAGLAIVASDQGGIPDILGDNTYGLLFPSGDVAAFERELLRLMCDDALRCSLSESARRQFLQRYTLESFELRLKDVLTAVVGASA